MGNQVRDLGPLLEVDFNYSQNQAGGFVFNTINERTKDFSPLKAVPCFAELNLGGMNSDKWSSIVKDSRILGLTCLASETRNSLNRSWRIIRSWNT